MTNANPAHKNTPPPKKATLKSIAVAVLVAMSVSFGGASLTDLGPWYQALTLPSWQPPGFVFPIVWTTIFILAATSAVMTWRRIHTRADATMMLVVYGANCLLNLMWSFLFFASHRPDWGLYQVGFFWLSILALIVFTWPRDRFAAALLAPYIIWVTIAAYLNYSIVQLNPAFS